MQIWVCAIFAIAHTYTLHITHKHKHIIMRFLVYILSSCCLVDTKWHICVEIARAQIRAVTMHPAQFVFSYHLLGLKKAHSRKHTFVTVMPKRVQCRTVFITKYKRLHCERMLSLLFKRQALIPWPGGTFWARLNIRI